MLLQNRDIARLRLAPSEFESQVAVGDEALEAFFEARSSAYRAPTRVRVEALRLDRFDFEDAQTISEEAVLAAYEREKAAFEGQEQREAAHILLTETNERDLEAARTLAESLLERLEAGEDFAALAEEFSDDPGSANDGGRLGAAARGTFVGPFENALFSMVPGELRGPVETDFGIHILRLDKVLTTELPSFDELAFSSGSGSEPRLRRTPLRPRPSLRAGLRALTSPSPQTRWLTLERPEPFSREGGEGILPPQRFETRPFPLRVRGLQQRGA